MKQFDITVVGAGIVGLSTAMQLSNKYPRFKIAVLEKESDVGIHQTGHNSGVIHSGIYYKPGSLKALNCREGKELLLKFCQKHNVPYEITGKLIVASNQSEEPALRELYDRGVKNGLVGLEFLEQEQIKEIEPKVKSTKALKVPETGIIDFKQLCFKYKELFVKGDNSLLLNNEIKKVRKENGQLLCITNNNEFLTKKLINCAGLQSDRVARLCGVNPEILIVPFRGTYYKLKKDKRSIIKNLIYPVPDPQFPFLGAHFTRMLNGEIEAGPNAALALDREGYENLFAISIKDFYSTFFSLSFWRMASKYWRMGFNEFRTSYSKKAFVKQLQKLVPSISESDIEQAPSGIRAQALDKQGRLLDDFSIIYDQNMIHVLNSPSPAATASLAIGKKICQLADKYFAFSV